MNRLAKMFNLVGLVADLLPGALLVLAGVAVIVGAETGVLWL